MYSLTDYVDWIAQSMGIRLDDDQLDILARSLAVNEDYKKVLSELEKNIWHISGKQRELDQIK